MKYLQGRIWLLSVFSAIALFTMLIRTASYAEEKTDDKPVWITIGALPRALSSVEVAVARSEDDTARIYLLGGKLSDGSPSANITLVKISADGATTFGTLPPMPVALYGHAAVAVCNRIYVIGGWDGSQWRSNVWSTQIISSTDSLAEWREEIGYPFPVAFHDAVFLRKQSASEDECKADDSNAIFVIGGQRLDTAVASSLSYKTETTRTIAAPDQQQDSPNQRDDEVTAQVFYSTIDHDGRLSLWHSPGPQLPSSLSRHSVAIKDETIYVTGGNNGHEAQSKFYSATVLADNSIMRWYTGTLEDEIEYHQAVVFDSKLWILGGRHHRDDHTDDVYSADIETNGHVGTWREQLDLPEDLYRLGAGAPLTPSIGIVYAGGLNSGGNSSSDIRRQVTVTPTPAPTNTPVPTPTPSPTPGIESIHLSTDWKKDIDSSQGLGYIIDYQNGTGGDLYNVVIRNEIPDGVELVPDSIQPNEQASHSGIGPGDIITWTFAKVASGTSGELSFRVVRPVPTPLPQSLILTKSGTRLASEGRMIDYELSVMNNLTANGSGPVMISNLVIADRIPVGTSLNDADDVTVTDSVIYWSLGDLELELGAVLTQSFSVIAGETITVVINDDYRVSWTDGKGNRITKKGTQPVVTHIGADLWLPAEDLIYNPGVTITWRCDPLLSNCELRSNPTFNPSVNIYLPIGAERK